MWGCLTKVVVPTTKKVKIGPKTIDCIFIGYAQNSNTHYFLVHKSKILDIHKNMIIESRNALLFEHVFPYRFKEEASLSKQTHETMTGNSQDQEQKDEIEAELRRSKRARTEKSFSLNFLSYMLESEF